jgi:hypothetical protein
MQFPTPTNQDWMKTLQDLLHYYLPAMKPSVASVGACLVATAVGLVVAFRSAKVARGLVCLVGLALGAGAGYQIALMAGGPAPVSAAIGGVVLGAIAWRTYKFWLAIGSVVAIVGAAMMFQLVSRGDLSAVLRELNEGKHQPGSQIVGRLPTASEQLDNLSGQSRQQLEKAWSSLSGQFKSWGLSGWVWPALALVAGIILALWALQVVAVMWLGLVGACLAVGGALGLAMMQFPQAQEEVIRRPDYLLGAVAIVWVFGLVWQAKSGRLGGKPAAKAAPAAAAS